MLMRLRCLHHTVYKLGLPEFIGLYAAIADRLIGTSVILYFLIFLFLFSHRERLFCSDIYGSVGICDIGRRKNSRRKERGRSRK